MRRRARTARRCRRRASAMAAHRSHRRCPRPGSRGTSRVPSLHRRQFADERSGAVPLRRCAEEQSSRSGTAPAAWRTTRTPRRSRTELIVLGEVVGAGRPQRHAGHHAGAAVVAEEDPLDVSGGERGGGRDQFIERDGRLDPGFLEQALAIDSSCMSSALRDGVEVAVVGESLQERLVEVGAASPRTSSSGRTWPA